MRKIWRIGVCTMAFGCAMQGQYRRGVNVAGAEFGMSNLPGTLGRDYTFNSENTFRYFADKGLGLIRFPLLWERMHRCWAVRWMSSNYMMNPFQFIRSARLILAHRPNGRGEGVAGWEELPSAS